MVDGWILSHADLSGKLPENTKKLAHLVEVTENTIEVNDHLVFYREALPPENHYAKGVVIFLHGQSYSSSTWEEHLNLQMFAAHGLHCIAPDLPGSGRTKGCALKNQEKPQFLLDFLSSLGVKHVMVISASMSAQYVLPLLTRDIFTCVIGVAMSNTNELVDVHRMRTPVLCVWGEMDTSLGPSSANNLKALPNSRLERIPSSGHACYLGNPQVFQRVCVNFFELVRSYHSVSEN